ncbi:hypothetical protein [Haloarcula brevis]|uniref:hypothetical protein n=1 Tax=Haloarcula brevis TaxID=3111453 RepID=UPI00300F7452
MRRKPLAAVLLLAVVAGAVAVGTGPLQDAGEGTAVPSETTGSAADAGGGGDAEDGSDAEDGTAGTPPFGFTVGAIEECGRTCRDVTSTLTNRQNSTAADVTVATRIYAGNTTDGDVVWEGSEAVGTLAPAGSYTTTRRVDLSFGDAVAIRRAGGWITVRTTVETADRSVTLTSQRQVA